MDDKTIHIITRTNNRPIGFKKCHNSIINQSYKNTIHWVVRDNKEASQYLESYSNINIINVPKNYTEDYKDIPNPNTGPKFKYNLYFNLIAPNINNGWILILDDDDALYSNYVLSNLIENASSDTDMLIYQMEYPNGAKLPTIHEMGKTPQLGRIGAPCVLVKSSIANKIQWDGWKCGDYRYIHKAFTLSNNVMWISKPMIKLGGIGSGKRKDISNNNKPLFIKKSRPKTINITTPLKYNDAVSIRNKISNKKNLPFYDIVIIISSYNRYDNLTKMLTHIKNEKNNFKIKTIVINDKSTDKKYGNLKEQFPDIDYYQHNKNYGKKLYWQTISELFLYSGNYNYNFLLHLDDDFKLCNRFFPRLIQEWYNFKNNYALNFKKEYQTIIKSGRWGYNDYVDGGALYSRDAIEHLGFSIHPIPKSRWLVNPAISSGVWNQVTKRLYAINGQAIKTTQYSLIDHLGYIDSKLNPNRNTDIHKMETYDFIDNHLNSQYCIIYKISNLEELQSLKNFIKVNKLNNYEINIFNDNEDIAFINELNKKVINLNSKQHNLIIANHSKYITLNNLFEHISSSNFNFILNLSPNNCSNFNYFNKNLLLNNNLLYFDNKDNFLCNCTNNQIIFDKNNTILNTYDSNYN